MIFLIIPNRGFEPGVQGSKKPKGPQYLFRIAIMVWVCIPHMGT